LGSAALLAQSAGVPVIASNLGGLREAVASGETGLLVENSVPEIAAAIRLLMDDARACARMAQAGRARIREKFPAARMVEATLAAYREAEAAR
jgi:glycosyltransferase involved in cell wall biosynthesis